MRDSVTLKDIKLHQHTFDTCYSVHCVEGEDGGERGLGEGVGETLGVWDGAGYERLSWWEGESREIPIA